MNPFKQLRNLFLSALVVSITAQFSGGVLAQSPADSAAGKSEKQIVMEVFESTKTLKTAKDFGQFIDQCNDALAFELNDKNRSYVQSIAGWAYNRRGNLRLETAEQLKDVGSAQSATVLDAAMSDFNNAVAADENRWRSWMSRGIAMVGRQQFAAAVDDFTRVIDLKPDEVKAWFNRAEAKFHDGNFAGAITDYDAVLAMKDQDLESRTGRGHAFFALGKYSEALADYQSVAQRLPNNRESQINLGDVYQQLGKWQDAQNAYAKATASEPTAIACQRFAWFKATCPAAEFRDALAAAQLIEQAIELAGKTPTNLDTLAAVQAANGNFDLAKETQQQLIQLTSGEMDEKSVVRKDYQTRMAQYEEGVPFQQSDEGKTNDQ